MARIYLSDLALKSQIVFPDFFHFLIQILFMSHPSYVSSTSVRQPSKSVFLYYPYLAFYIKETNRIYTITDIRYHVDYPNWDHKNLRWEVLQC